jgi:hypothetical protein
MQPLDDEFRQVRRSSVWGTRQGLVDRDALQGGLFFMLPTEDEFRSVRWSPVLRVRISQKDLDTSQGSLFVMLPTDDEFRSVRWSPVVRVLRSPSDADSNRPVPPVPTFFEDEFRNRYSPILLARRSLFVAQWVFGDLTGWPILKSPNIVIWVRDAGVQPGFFGSLIVAADASGDAGRSPGGSKDGALS